MQLLTELLITKIPLHNYYISSLLKYTGDYLFKIHSRNLAKNYS